MSVRRIPRTVRLDPEMLQIGIKLAKKLYGSEKRLGYVLDDAIRLLHLHETDPTEAQSYLTNIENQVVRSLEKRLDAIGRRGIESIEGQISKVNDRNANLLAKMVYDVSLMYVWLDKLCYRVMPDFKEQETTLRKEAAQRMKGKFTREGEAETGTVAEENERLREEIKEYKEMISRAKEVLTKQKEELETYQDQEKELREQIEEYQRQEREDEYLVNWLRGLEVYLRENYSRLKSNETLIEEYSRSNPRPRVV